MKKSVLPVARGAVIAALYVLLTFLSSAVGLSSGAVQVRISEALIVLVAVFPETAAALPVGCLIANLFFGLLPWDLLFGTLATVLGCLGALALSKTGKPWLIALPNVIANALLVPFSVILFAGGGGAWASFPFFALTVGAGEAVACVALGWFVFLAAKKIRR